MHRKYLLRLILLFMIASYLGAACGSQNIRPTAFSTSTEGVQTQTTESPTPSLGEVIPSKAAIASATSIPSSTLSPTSTKVPTPTATRQPTSTSTEIPSPTVQPTYSILRGTVLEQSNCRYGPGAAYLYKYGLYPGNYLEIIGRNELGTWLVVQAIGGTNPCWIKASLMDVKGDVMSVSPMSLPLPQSPYYGPVKGVSAVREGDSVIISWIPIILRAGDDSLQYPYLIEAWLCQAGKITFNAIGSWETIVTVQDEAGCSEPSHARLYGVEKHGYTAWITIPWPQP